MMMKKTDTAASVAANQLQTAKVLLSSKNFTRAEQLLKEILQVESKNPEALDLLAKILYLRDEKKAARNLWKQSLKHAKQPEVLFSNLHTFLHVLRKEGNLEAAAKHASMKLPEWPQNHTPNKQERDRIIDLANLLAKSGQYESARNLLEQIATTLHDDVEVMASIGIIQMLEEQYTEALETFTTVDRAIQPRSDLSLLARIYQAAAGVGNLELMTSIAERATDEHPTHNIPKQPEHSKSILILYGHPDLSGTTQADERGSQFKGNYPGQLREQLADEFHFSSIFTATETSRNAVKELPRPDLIINNQTNAETLAGQQDLPLLCDFIDSFGVPVVNHPNKALSTSREETVRLIRDIPGVIAPGTTRFSTLNRSRDDIVEEIESQVKYPFIIRTLSAQEGKGMVVVNDRESLYQSLDDKPGNFYTTEFIESRHESGLFRKVRAAIVGDEVHIVRVDHSPDWKVHGRMSNAPHRIEFYRQHPELLAAEERICANPSEELGESTMHILEEIRKRIPLEVFGIDFDVTSDGEILFFEANATMLLLSSADKSMPHPVEAEERLASSFRRYINEQTESNP
ncbi:hypothetical protein BOW28_06890 [Solemya velum gill symbiont]|uniref:tetratricopeptide repeat protein n=1 Tax=Solemya velum gill symbiont TaxID=2340 RepID=UPI00099785D5|nr:tetratricopeptide repeat protein [Solemya velum gill symbiont]OOZ17172.1 hypothetical protein BOW28_06890 [Solemya velum gill symbiont]OOZ26842.1 hypothetical protein BOW32_06785 [Solemya velum gill symbiont]